MIGMMLEDEDGNPVSNLGDLEPYIHFVAVDGARYPVTRITYQRNKITVEWRD